MTGTTELRWAIRASFELRGAVKRWLRAYCWSNGYDIDIQEERGWITSTLLVAITVPKDDVATVEYDIDGWLARSER